MCVSVKYALFFNHCINMDFEPVNKRCIMIISLKYDIIFKK